MKSLYIFLIAWLSITYSLLSYALQSNELEISKSFQSNHHIERVFTKHFLDSKKSPSVKLSTVSVVDRPSILVGQVNGENIYSISLHITQEGYLDARIDEELLAKMSQHEGEYLKVALYNPSSEANTWRVIGYELVNANIFPEKLKPIVLSFWGVKANLVVTQI